METLEFTSNRLLFLARNFSGSQPTFRISYCKKHMEVIDACSAFLKILISDDRVLASLHNGIIHVEYFRKIG
jgi:hypothetical protein